MIGAWQPSDVRIAAATRVGRGLLAAVAILALLELVLQVRAHLLTGQSAYTRLTGRATYAHDPGTGLRLLRPSAEIRGQRSVMHTNRYGLRGPDFPERPAAGEFRVVLLGASTIMGTYAASDDATSSGQRAKLLAPTRAGARVINAGVAGLTVEDQSTLLRRRLLAFEPDVLIWYPGLNDFSCHPRPPRGSAPVRWQMPSVPTWLIIPDLITKNTGWLRGSGRPTSSLLEPSVDLARLERDLRDGVRIARDAGVRVELVTSARNFSATMDPGEATRRAASALSARPCYSARSLAAAAETYDQVLRRVARVESVGLIDAAGELGTEPALFGDSTHLSKVGEQRLADLIHRSLLENGEPGAGPAR
jgi:lysophospholipase L1-like esterase